MAGDLPGDAVRRDFTVNCLYADLASMHEGCERVGIADPTASGLADLKAGLLRTPQDALFTMWLDPLRILRAVRFHAAGGYRISSDLLEAMDRMAYLLTRVSPERVRMEIERVLVSSRLESAMRLMLRTGVLAVVMPEVAQTDGFAQKTPYHAYDLFTHLLKTAAATPPDVVLRLAALLHDVGKISTQMAKPDRMVYYGHEKKSAETAAEVMRRLRFPNRSRELASLLVANHMINYSTAWSDRAVRRFATRMGSNLDSILKLAEADRRAQKPGRSRGRALMDLSRRILESQTVRGLGRALPLDGRDIMTILGIGEGRLVGRAKDFLLEEAANRRRPMTRSDAVRALKEWSVQGGVDVAERGPAGPCIGVDKPRTS
jgi:putative nucleotidyltransferase with HDIG domain